MILDLITRAGAEAPNHGTDGNVRGVECRGKPGVESNSHDPRGSLEHERTILKPDSVGKPHQERSDRCEDSIAGDISAPVGNDRTSVDHDVDRRRRWE